MTYSICADQNIAFKREYNNELVKDMIAFANTEGGTIYLGVDKYGQIIGLKDPDGDQSKIMCLLKDSIAPNMMPYVQIKPIKIDDKPTLVIDITPGVDRPYFIIKNGLTPSGVYVREGCSSIPLSNGGIFEMIEEVDGSSYEKQRSLNQTLSFETLASVMEKRHMTFDVSQMKAFHLVGDHGLYTNLAYMLSDQCTYVTKVARFSDSQKSINVHKVFTGSLLKQLIDSYSYLQSFNNATDHYDLNYPEEALRETLMNAFCHRDYSNHFSNLIKIYNDRIEFVSVGRLLSDYTLDSIFLGLSAPRNPYLYNVFYKLHYIEASGTGLTRIKSNYKDMVKQPLFEYAPGVFKVTLPNTSL